jgi:hypothetical protein
MSPSVVSPVFIGRQAELARGTALMERARAGEPAFLPIGGEAGVGKTRLIRELAGQASRGRGGCLSRARTGSAYPRQIPSGPISRQGPLVVGEGDGPGVAEPDGSGAGDEADGDDGIGPDEDDDGDGDGDGELAGCGERDGRPEWLAPPTRCERALRLAPGECAGRPGEAGATTLPP